MHTKLFSKKLLTALALFFLTSNLVFGAGIRGRLDGLGPYGPYPVAGVPVTVANPSMKWRSQPSYSDNQGMYYIYNLAPGSYVLEIWAGGPTPINFNIMVHNQPITDISPIRVKQFISWRTALQKAVSYKFARMTVLWLLPIQVYFKTYRSAIYTVMNNVSLGNSVAYF